MKGTTLAVLAGAILLSACASPTTDTAAGQQASSERGEPVLGSLFPQKGKNRPDHSIEANKQDMENSRIMNAGTNNSY